MSCVKKFGELLVVLLVVFWCSRIWSINQVSDNTHIYEMKQTIECGDIAICAKDNVFFTPKEFEDYFDLDARSIDDSDESYIIGVCLEITNNSDADIEWDEIISFVECGFESKTWASGINPLYGQFTNRFYTASLEAGSSQEVWFLTDVKKICFKESTWEHIEDENFYYVLSLSPYKVEIRLTI